MSGGGARRGNRGSPDEQIAAARNARPEQSHCAHQLEQHASWKEQPRVLDDAQQMIHAKQPNFSILARPVARHIESTTYTMLHCGSCSLNHDVHCLHLLQLACEHSSMSGQYWMYQYWCTGMMPRGCCRSTGCGCRQQLWLPVAQAAPPKR